MKQVMIEKKVLITITICSIIGFIANTFGSKLSYGNLNVSRICHTAAGSCLAVCSVLLIHTYINYIKTKNITKKI